MHSGIKMVEENKSIYFNDMTYGGYIKQLEAIHYSMIPDNVKFRMERDLKVEWRLQELERKTKRILEIVLG